MDGEPRVADEDLGADLEMSRDRSIRTNLIDPHWESLLMLGSIFRIDPKARQLTRFESEGGSQLHLSGAIADQLLDLLKTGGLDRPVEAGREAED